MHIEFNDTDNAAFEDGRREAEVASILRGIAKKVESGHTDGAIHDVNGNRIGRWWMDEVDEVGDE